MSVAMNEQETVIRFGRDSEECEITRLTQP